MQDLNVSVFTGRLTRDPQVRYTGGGTAVAEIGVAVNNRVKRGNEWQDAPAFIDVTIFGKQAEAVGEHLRKGSRVAVKGEIHLDQWEDKQTGQKKSKLKIVAETVQFLDGKPASSKPRGGSEEPPEDSEEPF